MSLWHVGRTKGCELNPVGNDEFLNTMCVCAPVYTHTHSTIVEYSLLKLSGVYSLHYSWKIRKAKSTTKSHMVLSPRTIRMKVCCNSLCSYSCLYQEYILYTIWYAAFFGQLPYTYSKCYLKIKFLSNYNIYSRNLGKYRKL